VRNVFFKEFPDKGWTRGGLNDLLAKIDKTGSFRRQPGSGHPRTARTVDNVEEVESLVLSQEDMLQTHRTQRQIAREIGISQSSVSCKKRSTDSLSNTRCQRTASSNCGGMGRNGSANL